LSQCSSSVSIIIPCYNTAPWVAEAIDSCLCQTYKPTEIIVVDDGSTDPSAQILEAYRGRAQVEVLPHRGGNQARNRGFALSRGEYIQFLDADDYLLPQKIERQVKFLEETSADVVYGDWRHQYHRPDGSSYLGEVAVSGTQDDVLESLLAGWWVAPAAILFRRQAVVDSGGWDETLLAAQDLDFFSAVAMTGADIRYQPGCFSIYRRYGNVTVSTGNHPRWLENHERVLNKAEAKLSTSGRLSARYRQALASSYFHLARNYYDLDRSRYTQLMHKTLALFPTFKPHESALYYFVWRVLGFPVAERLASYKRRVMKRSS
jgi:glycosyltransferase involved in cell wall biosynthesis